MDITELVSIIGESVRLNVTSPVTRDYESSLQSVAHEAKPIKVLTGLRRSGKSFLLKRLYQHLLASGIPQGNILFLNFENDRLRGYLTASGMRTIFKTYGLLAKPDQPRYVFLDEIQEVEDWHKFVRTIYDGDNFNIFITGSNGKLLSGEFASTLGGRVVEFKIRPFNFVELAEYHQVKFNPRDPFELEQKYTALHKIAQEYYEFGGIPEALALNPELRESYRHSLIEKIVVNDLVRRFQIESPQVLTDLCIFLERSLGGVISARNLATQGGISDVTVVRYLDLIASTFLIAPVQKYHFQARQMLDTQRKYYFVDNLFCRNAAHGARLENSVYCELARRYGSDRIFFARNDVGHEVDFLVFDQLNQVQAAFQVCFELHDKNYAREIAPLKLLAKYGREPVPMTLIYMHDTTKAVRRAEGAMIEHLLFERWVLGNDQGP